MENTPVTPIFDSEYLAKEIHETLPNLPAEEGHVGAVVQNGDFGVEGDVSKQLGKGVFVAAEGSWFSRAGYRAAAMIGWKKKS
jgi:hypothetical protein